MRNKLNPLILVLFFMAFCSQQELLGQSKVALSRTITDLEMFDADLNPLTEVCGRQNPTAGQTFTAIATLGPGNDLDPANAFILELSDADGNFDSGVQQLGQPITNQNGQIFSPVDLVFSGIEVPEGVGSDNHRIRIIATEEPSIISQTADYPFYYFDTTTIITLNNNQPIFVCIGSSINETISVTMANSSGSLDPNDFEFEWLRDGAIIAGQNGTSLQVTQEGRYFARVKLGACQLFYSLTAGAGTSNSVDVEQIEPSDVTISTPAPDLAFCPNEDKILISSEQDNDFEYQWFKDGEPIDGEIDFQISLPQSNFQGDYYLEVTYSSSCVVQSNILTVTNEGSSITQELPPQLILLPGQVITLEATTDAPNGSPYVWSVDSTPVDQGLTSGAPISIDASLVGRYLLTIDAQDPCNSQLSTQTDIFSPIGFDIDIGIIGDISCDEATIPLELIEMRGQTAGGESIPLTAEQLGFFAFEWYRDGVALGNNTTSLTVDSSDAGTYQLRADLISGGFTGLESNNVPISLVSSDITLDVNPPNLPDDGSAVTITAPFDNNYTYEWYTIVDGEDVIIDGEITNFLVTNVPGIYFVRISTLICSEDSETVNLGQVVAPTAFIPNVVTPNNDNINDNWILPSELANQQDVEVIIYDATGRLDFSSPSYQNNWPSENSVSQGNGSIYYYIITKNSTVYSKGSITVMR